VFAMNQPTANPRLADARNIAAILLLVGAVAGALWTVLGWVGTRVSSAEAAQIHDTMRLEYRAIGQKITLEIDESRRQWTDVARDVRTIKCLVDPRKKAKDKTGCGLE